MIQEYDNTGLNIGKPKKPHVEQIMNMKVTFAGYKYLGHYRKGYLEVILESSGCGVSVNPKDDFSMYNLFSVFDIDCEDGKPLSALIGKYCRVHFDKDRKVVALQHLIHDNIIWFVNPEV